MAEDAERAGAPVTAKAIVQTTAGVDVEEADRRRTWTAEIEALDARGSLACARALMGCLLGAFPDKEAVWLAAADLGAFRLSSAPPRHVYFSPPCVAVPQNDDAAPAPSSTPCSAPPSRAARTLRCCGSWPPRRSGSPGTSTARAASSASHFPLTRARSRCAELPLSPTFPLRASFTTPLLPCRFGLPLSRLSGSLTSTTALARSSSGRGRRRRRHACGKSRRSLSGRRAPSPRKRRCCWRALRGTLARPSCG